VAIRFADFLIDDIELWKGNRTSGDPARQLWRDDLSRLRWALRRQETQLKRARSNGNWTPLYTSEDLAECTADCRWVAMAQTCQLSRMPFALGEKPRDHPRPRA